MEKLYIQAKYENFGEENLDMIRKISGKQLSTSSVHLNKKDGTKWTERKDIANTLADEFQKNSSSANYSPDFQKFKTNIEKKKLNFKSRNNEDYNMIFNFNELQDSLGKCHDTATGPDEIHNQFLKHLPKHSLLVLLDLFNNI